jgi:hypothetical protein
MERLSNEFNIVQMALLVEEARRKEKREIAITGSVGFRPNGNRERSDVRLF